MTPWTHLPNAALIDEVLASLKADPEKWDAAWGAVWDAARSAAWDAARGAARGAARDTARGAAWDAARSAAWDAAWGAAPDAAWDAAWDAVEALVVYDAAGQFIKLPVEHLRRLYRIDPHPMFLLLQPAAIVFDPRTTP